jgi:hypothetical protein
MELIIALIVVIVASYCCIRLVDHFCDVFNPKR